MELNYFSITVYEACLIIKAFVLVVAISSEKLVKFIKFSRRLFFLVFKTCEKIRKYFMSLWDMLWESIYCWKIFDYIVFEVSIDKMRCNLKKTLWKYEDKLELFIEQIKILSFNAFIKLELEMFYVFTFLHMHIDCENRWIFHKFWFVLKSFIFDESS